MSAKVLIVEDEADLSQLLAYNLGKAGFDHAIVDDGDDALLAVEEERPDLVLLDWMLPNLSGIEICRQIRARKATRALPIIMLTARSDETDMLRGLERGADDYIAKPFSVTELMARVKALLRRSNPAAAADKIAIGDLTLDRVSRRAHRGRRELRLGPTEYRLLDLMISRPGRVYSRAELLDRVWSADAELELRSVDVMIGRLRRALNRRGDTDPIRTVRGAGYAFDETYGAEPDAP